MKIMLYSQHVLGVGHFFRSMEIAGALHPHEVLFVEGGTPLEGFVPPSHVRRLFLPPLMMDSEFTAMETHGGNLEEVKERRQRLLMDSFEGFAPDVFITELFPFGRKQFRFELMPVLEFIREGAIPTRVICSLRDILVEKKDQSAYEDAVLKILNSFFHLLFVHSDSRLIPLEETFENVEKIQIPIHYTGFVMRKASSPVRPHKGKVILASSGGGRVGAELLASTIQAVQALPEDDLRLRVFVGPFMEQNEQHALAGLAGRDIRTTVYPFSRDFLAELAEADLSISMAGYNTCMDILSTGIRALVHPFPQNREQALRAAKLQSRGLLRVLESLDVQYLSHAIREILKAPAVHPERVLDLAGAANTAALIEKHCGKEA